MDGCLQSLSAYVRSWGERGELVRVVWSHEHDEWVVLAYWHDAWRVVKRGSAFACTRYAAKVRAAN